jgi:hypothetical protein
VSEVTPRQAEEFRSAVAELHETVDAWAATVVGVGQEATEPEDALSDPRLEAVEDAFNDALSTFHGAAGPLLGLPVLVDLTDGDEHDHEIDDTDEGVLSLQFWLAAPERDRDAFLASALRIVDDAGMHVVHQLEEAGFTVASYASGLEELADLDDDEDDG